MAAVTARPNAGTMAMGRSMKYRVEPYADVNGMGYYKSLPDPIYDFTRKHLSKPHHVGLHVRANEKWNNYQMMQGKDLVDIGAPMGPRVEGIPPMDPSPYYDKELERVAGYPGYSQDPQPSWDLKP